MRALAAVTKNTKSAAALKRLNVHLTCDQVGGLSIRQMQLSSMRV